MAECPTCGDEFDTERGMKLHHVQAHDESIAGADVECEYCGSTFSARPSRKHMSRFCSEKCKNRAQEKVVRRKCDMCNRTFRVRDVFRPNSFCCKSCWAESDHNRPRPDDVDSLLWLLYVYEGHNHQETFERQRAVLGYEDRLLKDEVKERLKENGWFKEYQRTDKLLEDLSSDDVGMSTPDGDDSWKQYQRA